MCDFESDCNNRGYCVSNECLCDVAWFGTACDNNLDKTNPSAFVTYKVIFLIIYSFIGILGFYRLYSKVKKQKDLFARSTFLFVLKSMRSPYNLTMVAILVISITRILWLAIDPFGYREIIDRSLERVLFETTYSFLFMIYIIVLWVWGVIYEELSLQRNPKQGYSRFMKWFRGKLRFFVVIVIAIQMTTSILKGHHVDKLRTITLLLYVVLFFVLIIVILEYFIYGWLLHKCITDQEKTIKNQYDKLTIPALHAENALAAYEKELYSKKFNAQKDSSMSEKNKKGLFGLSKELSDHKSPQTEDLRYMNRLESENAEMIKTMKKVDTKILDFEQVANQDGYSLDHIEDMNAEQNSLPDQNSMPRTSHFAKSFSSPSNIKKHINSNKQIKDNWFDLKVQEIVDRHEAYLRPVDIVEDLGNEHIATNVSVIFDDNEDVIWDFEDINEIRIKEEQQKRRDIEIEQNKRSITRIRQKTVIRVASSLSTTKDRIADIYRLKLLDDASYLKNHQEITKNDKKVIRKIFSLTVIAICLEIIFVIITILIFGTNILQNNVGMITSMWITGFIEISSIVAIIGLFSIVETTEKENLRLIMRIGQNKNRINRLYGFILPPYLRQEASKRRLETRINQTTAHYFKGLDSTEN